MATNKYISQLTGSVSPALSGYTIYDDGIKTYKLTLTNLRNAIVPGLTSYATTGSNTFNGNQLIKGDIVISGSLTAQQYIISSSVTHITNQSLNGSSVFGNSMDDTHLFTGSVSITGSLHATTFSGDGSGLTNLSNVTGSVNKLAFISADKQINTPYFAHIINSGNGLGLGTSAYFSPAPERLMVDNGQSFNIATFQTSRQESYAEVNIKNFGSGSNSSADLVIWNDRTTESSSYVNLGINSSNYSGIDVGYGGDGYLINASNDLYIGSTSTEDHGHTHIFAGNLWDASSISIYNDGTIGFNTDKFDNTATTIPSSVDGFAYEFSGSVKLTNDLSVDGGISFYDGSTQTTAFTGVSISQVTDLGFAITGSNTFQDSQTVNGVIYTNQLYNNQQDLNIGASNYNNIGFWAEGGTINVTGSLLVNGTIDTQGYNINTNGGNIEGVNITSNGTLNLGGTLERITPYDDTNQINHAYTESAITYLTNLSTNFNLNIIFVDSTNNKALGFTMIIEQGSNAYNINTLSINDETVSILWHGGSIPSVNSNSTDIISLSLLRINNTWKVFGQLTTF